MKYKNSVDILLIQIQADKFAVKPVFTESHTEWLGPVLSWTNDINDKVHSGINLLTGMLVRL
jgi:hypothetical protein